MTVTVIISTLNRPESLAAALLALRYQRYRDFEVIVVEGPAEPGREVDLAHARDVRLVRCPEANVARSRNVGLAVASGDVVAFVDDDCIPAPEWLEDLVGAFEEPLVVGAGGVVFDATGCRRQYEYLTCDRLGNSSFDTDPSLEECLVPGADPFIYLPGCNMAFRRDALLQIEGFDQEFDYLYDEVEVCARLIDAGAHLRQLPGAAVQHVFLAGPVRAGDGEWRDPFPVLKNRVYFALRYGRDRHSTEEVMASARAYASELRRRADAAYDEGRLTAQERVRFVARLERGIEAGRARGLAAAGRVGLARMPGPTRIRPYEALHGGDAHPLKICLLSPEDPAEDIGGVGRQAAQTAAALAARGHEVHVLTSTAGEGRVEFEGGVWRHQVAVTDRRVPGLDGLAMSMDLYAAAAKYHEVLRLHERAPVDLVVAPLWKAEGLICLLDHRFATATRLVTPMKTIAAMHPSFATSHRVEGLIRLEAAVLRESRHVLAASRAIVAEVEARYGPLDARVELVPLGTADRAYERPGDDAGAEGQARSSPLAEGAPEAQDGSVEVLFVGRLERRKGVDVLLDAARQLLGEYPNVSFTLAGPDTPNTELGETYREAFRRRSDGASDLRDRVRFLGAVRDEELWELYRRADVFCAPSRYESFGNVLIEAMMFGKPVVACRTGGMPEVIEEGRCGYLADPGDAASLAACLRPLIEQPSLRRDFGLRSRAVYETRYALDRVAERLIEVYRRIASEQPADRVAAEEVADVLARPLAGLLELDDEEAPALARRLLDGSSHPIDYLHRIAGLFDAPTASFIDGVYRTILGRQPEPEGEASWRQYLLAGGDRLNMVIATAKCDEARRRGVPTRWLERLAAERHRNLPRRVHALWALPDDEFVRGLFKVVLGRAADDDAAIGFAHELSAGMSRADVVREVVESDEARERHVPDGWVDELDPSSTVSARLVAPRG